MNETKKNKSYLKITLIIIALLLVVFVGGSTYAHINGKETLISPLLRHLGIDNNKYEENATQLTQEDKQENVTVKLKDGVLDDTTLIIGYEINIDKNNPDAWIEVEGNYKLNNMSVKPINNIMEKISDTKYVYYQIFDSNEIKLNDIKNATIESDIYRISEYTETEDINSASKEYGTVHELEIKLIENVEIKNLVDSKTYEFPNAQEYEILENVKVSATELITGSYTNILKIKTDKTQYQGDSFEK